MANYTIELGRIYESGFPVFGFDYDFAIPEKKAEFERLFIQKFYNNEICAETPQRWRRYLEVKMKTIFPRYNLMLEASRIEYSILDNYNLTETTTREVTNKNNVIGSNSAENRTVGNDSINGNASFTNHTTDTNVRTNNLQSTTDHTESGNTDRTEKQTDIGKVTDNNTKSLDATKVSSNTPKSLLSLDDIKRNVYASNADRSDNKETEKNISDTTADRNASVKETNGRTTKDTVKADNSENLRSEGTNGGSSTNTASNSRLETNNLSGSMSQNTNGSTSEKLTLTRKGNIGVDTDSDMIEKHIKLQAKFANVYADFFEECYDLFIQLYN